MPPTYVSVDAVTGAAGVFSAVLILAGVVNVRYRIAKVKLTRLRDDTGKVGLVLRDQGTLAGFYGSQLGAGTDRDECAFPEPGVYAAAPGNGIEIGFAASVAGAQTVTVQLWYYPDAA